MTDIRDGLTALGIVVIASAAIFVTGMSIGEMRGRNACKTEVAKAQLTAMQDVRHVEHQAADASQTIGVKAAGQAQKIRTVTQEVIRYVPQFIPADSRLLSDGFVRLHDAAATGDTAGLADAAGGMDGALSTIGEAQALPIIAANYGECNEAIARANAWIEWAKAQKSIYGVSK